MDSKYINTLATPRREGIENYLKYNYDFASRKFR
jgi:hypothetical protein